MKIVEREGRRGAYILTHKGWFQSKKEDFLNMMTSLSHQLLSDLLQNIEKSTEVANRIEQSIMKELKEIDVDLKGEPWQNPQISEAINNVLYKQKINHNDLKKLFELLENFTSRVLFIHLQEFQFPGVLKLFMRWTFSKKI